MSNSKLLFCGFFLASFFISNAIAQDPWTSRLSQMPTARLGHSSCEVDGKIYVIGGSDSAESAAFASIDVYDPVTDIWTYKTEMPRARMGLTASFADGKIYIIGGANGMEIAFREVDVYDPLTNTWTIATDFLSPRFNLATDIFY